MKEEFFDFDLYEIPKPTVRISEGSLKDAVIIFVYNDDYEAHKGLLDKIIAAMGLDANSFNSIVKLNKGEELNVSALSNELTQYLISFGISPTKLGFNASFKAYKTYQSETFRVLLSHSLQKLTGSKELKVALWGELQKEFS